MKLDIIFGLTHFEKTGFYGLMGGSGNGVMSSFERSKLGWIQPVTIYTDKPNNYLPDAISTGVVKKININSSEYFLIDNHQRISYYESSYKQYNNGPSRSPGTGVLISHCTSSSIDIESCFGRWNWKKSGGLYIYPFEVESVNRITGEDKMDLVDKATTSKKKNHPDYRGSANDFMNPGYFQIFSPWSNPSTYPDTTNICIELAAIDENKVARVNIYTQNAVQQAPSKPQNLKASLLDPWTALLTWEPNIEPDVKTNGKYKIYRGESSGGEPYSWQQIALINAYKFGQPVTSFIDDQIGPSVFRKVYYKISAVDNTQLESVCSDYDWVSGRIPKEVSEKEAKKIEYTLAANYPNPFNPSTNINYAIKEAGLVKLKVYDILGAEVTELVNEIQEAGYHSVEFNSGNLPSGVYIYTMQVNGFTSSKKMLLMK
ncbi:MAG: T9SS type A sorting domain-containing protein [Ignavibacteriaceae bacterium]|jgi:hypothetical protein|nr:T9SS type A sorting domain-containing protein [Ignavibacteriaceae bacterium]